eukprot:SAG31_NODE_5830_length_2304_cov_2.628571_1_plen_60_part_00
MLLILLILLGAEAMVTPDKAVAGHHKVAAHLLKGPGQLGMPELVQHLEAEVQAHIAAAA